MPEYHALRKQLEDRLTRLLHRVGKIEGDLRQTHDPDWTERATALENDEVLEGLDEMTLREIEQIRTALKLDPDSWEANREFARMLFRHSHIPEAIPFFEKAASMMDSDWSNPMMLITCHEATGNKESMRKFAKLALERAEKAIAKDPTNGPALAVGAFSLAMFGEEERAREWTRRALLLDPDNLNMRYNLACTIVRQLGDADEAIEILRPYFEQTTSTTLMRHMEVDPDLDPLRGDRRFIDMMASAKSRLGIAEAAPNG